MPALKSAIIILISLFCFLFSGANAVFAAVVYLDPPQGNFQFGQTFIVSVKIDTGGECVNAAKVDIAFDQNVMRFVDFDRGNSIISLWMDAPSGQTGSSGKISFSGGMPGGYCGEIAGVSGESNVLAKLVFKTAEMRVVADTEPVSATVDISDSSEVYLHDGAGTKAALVARGAVYNFFQHTGLPRDEWQEAIRNDNTPPEQFELKLSRDPLMFDNRYFITFITTDKQTGIDRYEVSETPLGSKQEKDLWVVAVSPYALKDQALGSKIKVKAVDKAGNETIAEFTSGVAPTPVRPVNLVYMLAFLVAVIGIGWYLVKAFKKRSKRHE